MDRIELAGLQATYTRSVWYTLLVIFLVRCASPHAMIDMRRLLLP